MVAFEGTSGKVKQKNKERFEISTTFSLCLYLWVFGLKGNEALMRRGIKTEGKAVCLCVPITHDHNGPRLEGN